MATTLDISNANYFMVITILNGKLYFSPGNLLITSPFDSTRRNIACLQIKDSCIVNRNRDTILSIGDDCIEDYRQQTGAEEDCVYVDNMIGRMLQASTTATDQQSQADNDLIQNFMSYAILRAIKSSGAHREMNEEALKSWIYFIITPIEWGKRVTSDALFAVFAGSKFITPSSAFVMAAFNAMLLTYLHLESFAERNTLFNSKNILCELSVGKTEDASLSVDIFSVTRLKSGTHYGQFSMTIDPSFSIPTQSSTIRIQMNTGYKHLVEFFRNTVVKGRDELTTQACNELLTKLCASLFIYPLEACQFSPAIAEQDASVLRLITLEEIYQALCSQLDPIIPEILSIIEKEICITRVFFIVIPEIQELYPDPIEDVLFIIIMLVKFKLEASSIKKYKYIYNQAKRFHETVPYTATHEHLNKIVTGICLKLTEYKQDICQESRPLSSLAHTLDDTSRIDTINYVYLFTNQVFTQRVSVNENGTLERLSAQKSDITTLDQFLVLDDAERRFEETMLQFHLSESVLSLLESMFPEELLEFATLYRKPKVEPVPKKKENVTDDASCLNLENWYDTLHRRYGKLFRSGANDHGKSYTEIMADLVRLQSESDSARICITQQKHIGTFMMVYFGYLKETLAKDFGQDSDSTRYILMLEQLMRNVTIGQADDKLMRKALHHCGWVPESEENKRKLMVYDIEDNYPISECLQKENIKMIPAKAEFCVVTITRYYVKTCHFQALEDILPTDKYYKTGKIASNMDPIDFYKTICIYIWQHVQKSVYEADSLLEYPPDVDTMDIEFTLESYNSFKVAFTKYIMTTFPLTYASHPDEEHRFPLHLKQGNCSVILTNRLVLRWGVLPAFVNSTVLRKVLTLPWALFVFIRFSNFDDEKNLTLPMLRLLETELKRILEVRFSGMIWISSRQFTSVNAHQCLKSVIGDTAFGYEALKRGVIRTIDSGSFAVAFHYFDNNDKTSFVQVVSSESGVKQLISGTDACIVIKHGAPTDNSKKHHYISNLGLKIPNLKNVFKLDFIKINDTLQRGIGDIVAIPNHDHTILSSFDMRELIFGDDAEKFMSFPYVHLLLSHSLSGYRTSIVLESSVLRRSIATRSVFHPFKLAYFDSYDEKSY
ncbi:hypothetical protein MBANPS3_002848 [Mucor bainieri]